MDALALGMLRKERMETVGTTVARGILPRFGHVHGWRRGDAKCVPMGLSVLEANGGNRTKTATELTIGQAILYRKLKEYGVSDERARARARA